VAVAVAEAAKVALAHAGAIRRVPHLAHVAHARGGLQLTLDDKGLVS
jgi:hypothetical protein